MGLDLYDLWPPQLNRRQIPPRFRAESTRPRCHLNAWSSVTRLRYLYRNYYINVLWQNQQQIFTAAQQQQPSLLRILASESTLARDRVTAKDGARANFRKIVASFSSGDFFGSTVTRRTRRVRGGCWLEASALLCWEIIRSIHRSDRWFAIRCSSSIDI